MISSISNLCFIESQYDQAIKKFSKINLTFELALSKHFKMHILDILESDLILTINCISIQSPFFGINGNIFESDVNLNNYIEISEKITDYAKRNKIKNIVFGSPKQRNVNSENELHRAKRFFSHLNSISNEKTYWSIENNPTDYGTNFLNDIYQVNSFLVDNNYNNLRINLDIGALCQSENDKNFDLEIMNKVGHVHLNSMFLKLPNNREISFLKKIKSKVKENVFISLECLNIELNELERKIENL